MGKKANTIKLKVTDVKMIPKVIQVIAQIKDKNINEYLAYKALYYKDDTIDGSKLVINAETGRTNTIKVKANMDGSFITVTGKPNKKYLSCSAKRLDNLGKFSQFTLIMSNCANNKIDPSKDFDNNRKQLSQSHGDQVSMILSSEDLQSYGNEWYLKLSSTLESEANLECISVD